MDLQTLPEKQINIHLFRLNAIILHIYYQEDQPTIENIDLDVGLLLYNDSDYPVVEKDVQAAYSLLIEAASPLLKDPLKDSVGLAPGLAKGLLRGLSRGFSRSLARELEPFDNGLVFVREVTTKLYLLGVNAEDIHVLGSQIHWDNPEVFYSIDPCVKLGDIYLGIEDLKTSDQYSKEPFDDSMCCCLSVRFLRPQYPNYPSLPFRYFDLHHANMIQIMQPWLRWLRAVHLPAPDSISGENDLAKIGRAIAMHYELKDLNSNFMEVLDLVLKRRKKTFNDLDKFVKDETLRLKPIPLQTLAEDAYVRNEALRIHDFDWPMHPLVAASLAGAS